MLPVPITNSAPSTRTRANTTPSPSTQSVTMIQKRQPTRMKTLEPDAKRPTQIPWPYQVKLPYDIGMYVARDAEEATRLGWTEFVRWRRGRGDFASLSAVEHLARHLLRKCKHRGAPVVVMTGEWTEGEDLAALAREPHKSTTKHAPFLRKEFASMVDKGQWTVLPYSVVKRLPGLRLSLPGVKVERDRRLRWLRDYSYYKTNAKNLPVACLSVIQYSRALDRLIRDIVFSDLALRPVYILKMDVLDGFYRIGVRPEDAPKLGLIFPSGAYKEPMVATPLTLPMGWKNPPPVLCTATEMVADLANESLRSPQPIRPHKLDNRAESVAPPPAPPLAKKHAQLTCDPYLRRTNAKLLAYVDVFVDNFLGLAQGPRHRLRHVRCTLFHVLDKVFRLLDRQEAKQRREVI